MSNPLDNYGAVFWCPPGVEDTAENWTVNHVYEGSFDDCGWTTLCGERIGDPYQDNTLDAGLFCAECRTALAAKGISLPE